MSQLMPFVRAFRALAVGLEAEGDRMAEKAKEENVNLSTSMARLDNASLLYSLTASFLRAATDLEQQIASDAARLNRQPVAPE